MTSDKNKMGECAQTGASSIPADFRDKLASFESWSVSDVPTGMVGRAGTSADYVTGGWRSERPIWDEAKCRHCMLCWVNCPDSSILLEDGKMVGINYDHCKGCGLCFVECRFDALAMVPEHGDHPEPEESAEAEPEITEGA